MTSTVVPQTAARMRRIDLRVLLGLALLLAGVLGTLAIVQQAGQRSPVLVMARSVQAGQVIGAADVRVAELGTAPGVATLGAGERALAAGQVAMSLALAPEHAAAGQLRAGDRVAVVASGKPDEPGGDVGSGVLLSPVQVLSVLPQGDENGSDRRLLV